MLDRTAFARNLKHAVVEALAEFRRQVPGESPYAFGVILGQCGNYVGYAVATEEGLRRVAAKYAEMGYCYQGREWEEFDNQELLSAWLRWANPDDGWQYGDFPDAFGIADELTCLVNGGAFGVAAEELDEFCTEVLAELQSDPAWVAVVSGARVVVGVTSGEDPRDFLRTATRANEYRAVQQLWGEYWWGEELSGRIRSPRSGRAADHDPANPPAAGRWSWAFRGEDVVSEGEIFVPGRITFVHSIRDLLREIRERPAMCLNAKTLTGLKCLLFGYEIACNKHDIAEAEQLPDGVPWRGFSEWLARRYDKVDWSVDWHWLLLEHSGAEEEAFDCFFELLAEYESGL
jgi:Domain of unknown function (DUF4303)